MARALGFLNGQALESVRISPADGATKFRFDLGCELLTQPNLEAYNADDEQWILRHGAGDHLSVTGDGRYSEHSDETEPADAEWLLNPRP